MKKIVLTLIVLLFATPAWAVVDITAVQVGDTNEVIISFVNDDLGSNVRAFGLNIQLDNDANILEATGLSADYWVYPGSILIDAEGLVTDEGTIAADYFDLESDTLPGPPDGNGVTLEAASLYAPPGLGSPNEPFRSGDLASIIVSKSCTLCITANVSRAGADGVVMEDPDEAVTVYYPSVCLDVVLPPPGGCPGDVTGTVTGYIPPTPFDPASFDSTLWTGPDGKTDAYDVQSLIYLLVWEGVGLVVTPVPAEAAAADVTGTATGYIPPTPFDPASFDSSLWTGPDGKIDAYDVQSLIYLLVWDGVGLEYTCP